MSGFPPIALFQELTQRQQAWPTHYHFSLLPCTPGLESRSHYCSTGYPVEAFIHSLPLTSPGFAPPSSPAHYWSVHRRALHSFSHSLKLS